MSDNIKKADNFMKLGATSLVVAVGASIVTGVSFFYGNNDIIDSTKLVLIGSWGLALASFIGNEYFYSKEIDSIYPEKESIHSKLLSKESYLEKAKQIRNEVNDYIHQPETAKVSIK